MLQNIPPYFIRGRGESEPSRDSREERSSSGELLLSDIAPSSGPATLRNVGKEVAGRRRSRDGWRPEATRRRAEGPGGGQKEATEEGTRTSNAKGLIGNERRRQSWRRGGGEKKRRRRRRQVDSLNETLQ